MVAGLLMLASCGVSDAGIDGMKSLEQHIAENRVGKDPDQWIEILNMAGEWEKTGLIFGYMGDFEECQTAIAGLKKVNFNREYRCTPANK